MQSVPTSSLHLPSCHYSIVGRSRAGDGTTFVIPELKWMFDCGALVQKGRGSRQPILLWLTHTHGDHVLTLAQLCYDNRRCKQTQKPLPIYLPHKALPFVREYLKAYEAMITMGQQQQQPEDDHEESDKGTEKDDNLLCYELIGVIPNQEINIRQNGKYFRVKVVECVHRIDCVGYSIFEQKQKLKQEYQGLPSKDIGALRKQGIDITTTETYPILCYLGDTTAAVFTKNPEILQHHSIIVVECSFLEDDSMEKAQQSQHMHWKDLKPIVHAHPTTLFVLTHFSLKYNVVFLRNFFCQHGNNLHPMLVEAEVADLWHDWQQQQESKERQQSDDKDETPPPSCNCFLCQPNNIIE
jgi:ribonuclease Z